MLEMNSFLVPGNLVTNPNEPQWGQGQIQSVIGRLITVNFENVGKLTIDGSKIELELLED